ncbi:MAG: nickel-dependent lactate racemase [Bacillota bacterium]
MKTVHSIPYGDHLVAVEIPADALAGVLRAEPLPSERSEVEVVREALANPIASSEMHELVQKGDSVCILVGDMTRLWVRHHVFLPLLLDELGRAGVRDDDVVIVSATGDHREQTEEEHVRLVGEEVYSRVRIVDHHSRDEENLVYMGHTRAGTPVKVNRVVAAADRVIATGGIVYHFLAGFGGGGKAVLPGVAGYETIMANHSLALGREPGSGLSPRVVAGRLQGNPCYEDIIAGASMVAPTFLLNVIVDEHRHRISLAVAGEMEAAHRVGCRLVEEHFQVGIEHRADLIIASAGGYPKDIDLYQTYKTVYNARRAAVDGGTLLIVSECGEGMGNDDFAAMFFDHDDDDEREAALREVFTIGGFMALHDRMMAAECDILLLSSLPEEQVTPTGMTPVSSVEDAMDIVRAKHGGVPPTYLIPYGSVFPAVR